MIIQNVPFFPNTLDDTHCVQAVFKMILKYFIPDREFSFEELDQLSEKVKDKWTWTYKINLSLQKMGFEIIDMSTFDSQKFASLGQTYLIEHLGSKAAQKQMEKSDVAQAMIDAGQHIKVIKENLVVPEISDIKKYLDNGYLVGCMINAQVLQNKSGYTGHAVLVIGYDKDNVIIHDPGAPPLPNRKVPFKLFTQAWGYPDHQNQNLTAFKLR